MPSTRRKRKEIEEDSDEIKEDENSVTSKDPNDDFSPPGMKLRSGQKKKRRRSKETNNDETVADTKKRRIADDDEDNESMADDDDDQQDSESEEEEGEEDSEMGESDGDDEEQDQEDDQKMPAVEAEIPTNGSHHASEGNGSTIDQPLPAAAPPPHEESKTSSPKARVPKVSKLRLPSKHTPGKLKETRRLRPEQQEDNHQIPVPPSTTGRLVFDRHPAAQHQLQTATEESKMDESDILENGDKQAPQEGARQYVSETFSLAAIQATMTQMIAPEREQVETAMDEVEPLQQQQQESSKKFGYLTRTPVWFALFLLLQMIFWPLWIHPILSTVVDTSKVLLPHYKGFFGSNVTVEVVPIAVDKATEQKRAKELKDSQLKFETERQNKLAELVKLKDNFKRQVDALSKDVDSLQKEALKTKSVLTQHKGPMEAAAKSTKETQKLLEQVLEEGDIASSPLLPDIRKRLGAEEAFLADVAALELWDVSVGEGCHQVQKLDNILQKKALVDSIREFKDLLDVQTREIMESEETDEFMRNWVLENGVSDLAVAVEQQPAKTARRKQQSAAGSSLDEIATLVQARIDVESADQTGRVDYASLRMGASVIRTGDRATTPSLVDSLPVANRMMSLLALRFYGYGPEAALTPTHPPTSLGQCWAFEQSLQSKYSGYGTLTVRLANPIYVESVSIEHPPEELTDHSKTAIRNFRVVGFEDADAQGKPVVLGSFEYKIHSDIRQEFEVNEEDEDGDEIPMLHSISLAVDSNWGHHYACLYRFRVHGSER